MELVYCVLFRLVFSYYATPPPSDLGDIVFYPVRPSDFLSKSMSNLVNATPLTILARSF